MYSDVLTFNAYLHESVSTGIHLAVSFMEIYMSFLGGYTRQKQQVEASRALDYSLYPTDTSPWLCGDWPS